MLASVRASVCCTPAHAMFKAPVSLHTHIHTVHREHLFAVHLHMQCSLRAPLFGYLHLYCSFKATLSCLTSALAFFIEFHSYIFWLPSSALFTESLSSLHTGPADSTPFWSKPCWLLYCFATCVTMTCTPCSHGRALTAPTLHVVIQPHLFLPSFLGLLGHSFACITVWACVHACH